MHIVQCGPCLFHHINARAHLTVTTDEGDEGDQGDQGNHGDEGDQSYQGDEGE